MLSKAAARLGVSHRGSTTFIFHSDFYSPSGSWPRMPRIVALPASPPFCTEGLGFIPMALILTGFRQNNKTQAIPTSVAKIINARQGSGPSWGFASREHDIYFHLPFYFHSASWQLKAVQAGLSVTYLIADAFP